MGLLSPWEGGGSIGKKYSYFLKLEANIFIGIFFVTYFVALCLDQSMHNLVLPPLRSQPSSRFSQTRQKYGMQQVLTEKKAEFDPRAYLKPAIVAMEEVCVDRFERFNCAGQASKIKAIPLADMAGRYADGSLDPTVN